MPESGYTFRAGFGHLLLQAVRNPPRVLPEAIQGEDVSDLRARRIEPMQNAFAIA